MYLFSSSSLLPLLHVTFMADKRETISSAVLTVSDGSINECGSDVSDSREMQTEPPSESRSSSLRHIAVTDRKLIPILNQVQHQLHERRPALEWGRGGEEEAGEDPWQHLAPTCVASFVPRRLSSAEYRLVSFAISPFLPPGMPRSMRSINVILNSADVPARATMQVFFPLCGFPLEYVNKA